MTMETVHQLSAALNVPVYEQDWGIINADPRRVAEFVAFYELESRSTPSALNLGELVIASANDAIEAGLLDSELEATLRRFVVGRGDEFSPVIKYWTELPADFPVAARLRHWLGMPTLALAIKYVGFWDIPRRFVTVHLDELYLFDSSFRDDLDEYDPKYTVYKIMSDADGTPSLENVDLTDFESCSAELIGHVPTALAKFDVTVRKSVDSDVFRHLTCVQTTN